MSIEKKMAAKAEGKTEGFWEWLFGGVESTGGRG
jgi:hypothetical protein